MKAPTPPPHAIVSYLESGGSKFFSAECQELLIRAGMNPEWFGSFNRVEQMRKDALEKRFAWDAMTPAEQAANEELRPTAEDRFLAQCQTGHLVNDAVHKHRPRPIPGKVEKRHHCNYRVNGYVTTQAPSFPSSRRGAVHSVEQLIRAEEDRQREGRYNDATAGMTPPSLPDTVPYSETDRQSDDDERTDTLLDAHKSRFGGPSEELPSATTDPLGANLSDEEFKQTQDMIGAADPTEPSIDDSAIVKGKTAAKCINNWRERAETEMKDQGPDREIGELQALEAQHSKVPSELVQQERAAAKRRNEAEDAVKDAETARDAASTPADRARLQEEVVRRNAAHRLAKLQHSTARHRIQTAERASSYIPCLESSRDRARAGSPPSSGVVWRGN